MSILNTRQLMQPRRASLAAALWTGPGDLPGEMEVHLSECYGFAIRSFSTLAYHMF